MIISYKQYLKHLNTLCLNPCDIKSEEVIKRAYRKLVMKNHPDRFRTQASKDKATETFKRITKAYEEVLASYMTYMYYDNSKQEQKKSKATKSDVIKKPKQKKQEQKRQAPTTYRPKLDFDTLFEICFEGVAI